MNTPTTLRLIFDVEYNLNGETVQEISTRLERAAFHAVGEGLLTGDTRAEVETYGVTVAEVPPALSEEDLSNFMLKQIENGQLELGDIPVRLARFGLMEPGAFVSEMRERMEMAAGEANEDCGRAPLFHNAAVCTTRYLISPPSARLLRAMGRGMQTNSVRISSTDNRTFA